MSVDNQYESPYLSQRRQYKISEVARQSGTVSLASLLPIFIDPHIPILSDNKFIPPHEYS